MESIAAVLSIFAAAILFFNETNGVNVDGNCSFAVNGDLKDSTPLFVHHNSSDWFYPDSDGVVRLDNGQLIDMYCNTGFDEPFKKLTKITAQCLQNQYFLVDGLIYPFANFTCTTSPKSTARRTGRPCNGGTDLLEVGFILDEIGFLQTMDICHDEINEATRYVHHVLNPASANYQRSVGRPRFIEGDFYGNKSVDKLYTQEQQKRTISGILGFDASPYFNVSQNIFLARGHLAAKTDFIFSAPQKATFFFVNVAPQWQTFNGGNWESVESSVRRYVGKYNLTTDCYTGTWGISTLPDVNGNPQQLYLGFDENNNGLIPVPMIYFRIIIDRESRKGIVIIGVNNPHASLDQIQEEYIICKDIGEQIDWISWSKENLGKGYSYACTVPDFTAVVDDLPLADLSVTGILGIPEIDSDYKFL